MNQESARKIKMLVVDDKEEGVLLLRTIFEHQNYDVMTASNGEEAWKKIQKELPDIIISDILMPEMDGFTLCHKVKQDEELRFIPFIILTATYLEKKDEWLALKTGADLFLRKPITPQALIQEVTGILQDALAKKLVSDDPPFQKTAFLEIHSDRLLEKLEEKTQEIEMQRKGRNSTNADRTESATP
ncbi:MAG: response regulator [Patescibacteria group bacterium]